MTLWSSLILLRGNRDMSKKPKKDKPMTTAIVPPMPTGVRRIEPDDDRYKNKFQVNSATSNRVYRISYDAAPGAGWYTCSCRGNISHGSCKHLESIGLRPTRKDIMQRRVSDGKTPATKPTANPRQIKGR